MLNSLIQPFHNVHMYQNITLYIRNNFSDYIFLKINLKKIKRGSVLLLGLLNDYCDLLRFTFSHILTEFPLCARLQANFQDMTMNKIGVFLPHESTRWKLRGTRVTVLSMSRDVPLPPSTPSSSVPTLIDSHFTCHKTNLHIDSCIMVYWGK